MTHFCQQATSVNKWSMFCLSTWLNQKVEFIIYDARQGKLQDSVQWQSICPWPYWHILVRKWHAIDL